ncbi:MAG: FHA domain-containing protein [Synechococcales bacterium]|nr:FHA domain-containing protein [Synechococcales bacterium]
MMLNRLGMMLNIEPSNPSEPAELATIHSALASSPITTVPSLIRDFPEDLEEGRDTEHGDAERLSRLVSDQATVSDLAIPPSPSLVSKRLSYYIQATRLEHRGRLKTNLTQLGETQVTEMGSTWLLGRSRNCAIPVPDRSISRCHAVIGYDQAQGFYLMDVGSSNGTFLNQKRLSILERYPLKDGDLINLCHVLIEFFEV